jgi:acetyl-CoA carboxylase beta subunit
LEFIKPENKDERVHDICNYLKANQGLRARCEKCPESQYSEDIEDNVQRGCYTVAHEMYRVAMTGKWYDEQPKEKDDV